MRERKTNIPRSSNIVFNPSSVPGMYHQVHTSGDHQGSKSNQHPHLMEKQIKSNTNYGICPLSMPYLSGEHIHTLSACCDSQWEILCRHFGQWVIDFGVLSCFLFSPSHSLVLCYKHTSCWSQPTHHMPTLCFPFPISPSNILCGLPTFLFSLNYFWLSGRYIVWISAYVPQR